MAFDLVVLLLLIAGSGFFSATETALFSLTRQELISLKNAAHPRLNLIYEVLQTPNRVLTSLMLGNNAANIMLVIWTAYFLQKTPFLETINHANPTAGLLLEIVGITGMILIFGEIIPKSFALNHAANLARALILPFFLFHKVLVWLRVQWVLANINKFRRIRVLSGRLLYNLA